MNNLTPEEASFLLNTLTNYVEPHLRGVTSHASRLYNSTRNKLAEMAIPPVSQEVEEAAAMSTYGRCDTCGHPCDEQGCTIDRSHDIALI